MPNLKKLSLQGVGVSWRAGIAREGPWDFTDIMEIILRKNIIQDLNLYGHFTVRDNDSTLLKRINALSVHENTRLQRATIRNDAFCCSDLIQTVIYGATLNRFGKPRTLDEHIMTLSEFVDLLGNTLELNNNELHRPEMRQYMILYGLLRHNPSLWSRAFEDSLPVVVIANNKKARTSL
jgi:glycerophosphoryl diester phosphodiesterase